MKAESFLQAIRCLPPQTAAILRSLSNRERAGCEEIRLRAGQPISIECGGAPPRGPKAAIIRLWDIGEPSWGWGRLLRDQ